MSTRLRSSLFRCLAAAAACGAIVAIARAESPPAGVGVPPIRLNTVGYLPTAPKRATIAVPCEKFAVVRAADGSTVFEGSASGPVHNDDTDEQLSVADFSALQEPGEYRLEVPGVGQSAPFHIAADLYCRPFRAVTRGMYLTRCGTEVRGEADGPPFAHAACHLEDGYLDLVGNKGEQRNGVGGWHDAGDFNKYVVNAAVTVGCMLRAWEDFGSQLAKISLDIPESGGPRPDFLAELKWELDWLLKMQADDGSVHNKLSALNYCGYTMPERDKDRRYFAPWGSAATADFVAMMAAAARVYRPYDPAYADRCLVAARKSYEFLQAHPEDHQPNNEGFTTVAYQSQDWDDRLWAAAELWETTGDAAALADFESRAASPQPAARFRGNSTADDHVISQYEIATNWDWANVENLALLTYLCSERPGRNPELVAHIRASLIKAADRIVETCNAHGYARPLGSRYYWGCNGGVARQAVVLMAADRIAAKPNSEYRATALDALNFLFGRNVHGRSYVTGLGDHPPLHPHDRRSAADKIAEPWPGYLVGGPNKDARDWRDEQDDYRTNEIAINWNGALIYALAAFVAERDEADAPSRTIEGKK